MAHFSQERIRSIIYALWQQASDANGSFLDLLNACHAGKWQRNQNGFILQASSGSGFSQSFHVPMSNADPSNMTDANLQDTFKNILDAYKCNIQNGLAEDNQDALFSPFENALEAQFQTIKGYTPNNMWALT